MSNLVEVGRSQVIQMGSSLYMKVPDCLKRRFAPGRGDMATFHAASDDGDTVVRIEKKTPDQNENPGGTEAGH